MSGACCRNVEIRQYASCQKVDFVRLKDQAIQAKKQTSVVWLGTKEEHEAPARATQ